MDAKTQKEKYIALLPKTIPIFHQPFWLDFVAEGMWDVVIVESDNKIIAPMPYCIRRRRMNNYIFMPLLTQILGPHFILDNQGKRVSTYYKETEIIKKLLDGLPDFGLYHQRWHFNYQNYLPLYWNDFKVSIRHTYRLNNISVEDAWVGLKENVRNDIRKAQKLVDIMDGISLDEFYGLIQKTFFKSNASVPYDKEFFANLVLLCQRHQCGKVLCAVDKRTNEYHAAIFLVYDNNTVYYLVSGLEKGIKNSGAMSYLLWEGIQFALTSNREFDFEGSMLPNVEPFFRNFGGERKCFFEVTKRNSRLEKFIEGVQWIKKSVSLKK